MQRVLVLLLSALDAFVAVLVGIAAAFAPLMVLWFVVFGAGDASALWQTTVAVWQLGHGVPLHITLPDAYLAANAIDPSLARFVLSLAPLGFAAASLLFGARSGARAARAGAWITGVLSGAVVFAAFAAVAAVTARSGLAAVYLWQAVAFPAAFYAAGLVLGAVPTAWREGDDGVLDAFRRRLGRVSDAWLSVPGLAVRGAAIAVTGVVGAGALVTAVALILRGGTIVALSQSANLDLWGVIAMGLAQVLYLPTLIVWAVSFLSGPGFAVGVGTSVTPAGTQLGVVPGVPLLGVLPDSTSPWLLVLALLPIAAGALAGWAVRSRLQRDAEPAGPRAVIAVAIAALSAAVAALLCLVASGSLGPDRLSQVGPEPGPVALAIGLEVLVGAGILLLSPRARHD
ncbi:DUF6350 family protein [Microbacterium sp. SORGH_AS_0888]|uniref:cell division protein PerM n=1 Tax=Microbacterium sp. SORGH_AS_0888 TaxID=3041791 RepID=UPI0027802B80|nr:DUF6350 family protein [Microbacterium sp. SORGH_AS_0888]MDQ1131256.1 hypothetical protein [Microbacterium sp. SORGH_AS_0888]